MTTNKPEVVAWKVRDEIFHSKEDAVAASAFHSRHCDLEPLIRLSDYEALQAECEQLQAECEQLRNLLVEIERGCSRRDMPSEQTISSWADAIAAHRKQEDRPCTSTA